MSNRSISDIMPYIKEAFAKGKAVILPIVGTSMSPLLYHGRDSVILKELQNPQDLKKYDVPLYKNDDGKYIMHRAIKIGKDTFDACGDHQTKPQKGIPKSSVAAIAVGFRRNGTEFYTDNRRYRLYSKLWTLCLPFRGILLKINYKLRKKR